MTEYTAYECNVTGQRSRDTDPMVFLDVVFHSDAWRNPSRRTFHVHIDAVFDGDVELDDTLRDDENTELFHDSFCVRDGEVVGMTAISRRFIGPSVDGDETVFVERERFPAYYERLAELTEEIIDDE